MYCKTTQERNGAESMRSHQLLSYARISQHSMVYLFEIKFLLQKRKRLTFPIRPITVMIFWDVITCSVIGR
jgi:hypothetical protein